MIDCDTLLINATLLDRKGHTLPNHALAIKAGIIGWRGSMEELSKGILESARNVEDCQRKLVTPALIDCHTHLVYAGNRADEFALRLKGVSYEEIAHKGGGIISTVKKTRVASKDELIEQSLPRLLAMRKEGVLTVEIKSGYGLDLQTELKMLHVARQLQQEADVDVFTTYLGAHAVPPEYQNNRKAYVEYVCEEVLPAVAESGLADAVDVFCESIAFSVMETEQIFAAAKKYHLPVKCHAEQLSNIGASSLAARYGALSADHLEYLHEKDIEAMANAGTTAVLLPGAYYFLRETQKPPVSLLRQHQVGMAVATDCNPGSSPTTSLPLMMNMACQLFSLTVPEVWAGVTYQAARALGISHKKGVLEKGFKADLLRWSIHDPAELCYQFGYPFSHEKMIAGQWVKEK
ncbi:imidazolonepropionase [Legionella londiniensis]|uniref:Imidazolonepropionase n=1 Tax=Legionella londiniensis TaxID=45068 RepID=A0A0W0VP51_9GAMM|nr:imidazolonepropionase [Legionella londiniensis]KTD21879.1 imidazolonepropionase [Legionella londiniensis]STX92638.1 imidazolonepropionase [Legionella londiniensis]